MAYSFLNFSHPVIMYAIENTIPINVWGKIFFKTFDIGQNNYSYYYLLFYLFSRGDIMNEITHAVYIIVPFT